MWVVSECLVGGDSLELRAETPGRWVRLGCDKAVAEGLQREALPRAASSFACVAAMALAVAIFFLIPSGTGMIAVLRPADLAITSNAWLS